MSSLALLKSKMKTIFASVFFLLIFPTIAFAQPKQKAETAFLAKLNSALNSSEAESRGYGFQDSKIIDAPFSIDGKGNLSLTIRRINADSSVVISKMEAPVNKINHVAYDLYLILEFEGDNVTWQTSKLNSNKIAKSYKTNDLSVGIPWPEDKRHQIELQKLLNEVLKYYKK